MVMFIMVMFIMVMLIKLFKLLYLIFLEPFIRCLVGFFKGKKKRDFTSDIALITGAAQGLGKEIAIQFAKHGCVLILWDINESKLVKTCSELTAQGYEAFAYVVDCSKRDEIYRTAQRVKEEVGNVSILVNNAGVLNGKLLMDLEEERIQRLIDINFLSHYWTIKSFLPWMMDNDYGTIVAISSMSSFVTMPFLSDYSASKSAVTSLCESLRDELVYFGNHGISVTSVHPGLIATGILDNHLDLMKSAKYELPPMSPAYVAEQIIKGVSDRKRTVIIPKYAIIFVYIQMLLPEKAYSYFREQMINTLLNKKFHNK